MPIRAQSLHHYIRHRLLALPAFGAVSVRVTAHAPRIPVLLDKRCRAIERISTLRTEEVASMPFGTASHDHFTLDWRLAAFASWAEQLVEVEMAVETERLVV